MYRYVFYLVCSWLGKAGLDAIHIWVCRYWIPIIDSSYQFTLFFEVRVCYSINLFLYHILTILRYMINYVISCYGP